MLKILDEIERRKLNNNQILVSLETVSQDKTAYFSFSSQRLVPPRLGGLGSSVRLNPIVPPT